MNLDNKTLEFKLKEIGMAEKEAKVFGVAGIRLKCGAGDSQKADINRATTYVIIEN